MKALYTIKFYSALFLLVLGCTFSVFAENNQPEKEQSFGLAEEHILIFDLYGNLIIDNKVVQADEKTHQAKLSHLMLISVVLTESDGTSFRIIDKF
jgi:hypothetical protein